MKKILFYLFAFAWTSWFILGISENYSKYDLLSWVILILLYSIPFYIYSHRKGKKKKSPYVHQASGDLDSNMSDLQSASVTPKSPATLNDEVTQKSSITEIETKTSVTPLSSDNESHIWETIDKRKRALL